jgi:hypothetical protein
MTHRTRMSAFGVSTFIMRGLSNLHVEFRLTDA